MKVTKKDLAKLKKVLKEEYGNELGSEIFYAYGSIYKKSYQENWSENYKSKPKKKKKSKKMLQVGNFQIAEEQRLPDNDQWTNRFKIGSDSSNRVYIIAQNKNELTWACSCPGWKRFRKCKHLVKLGLIEGSLKPNPFTSGYEENDSIPTATEVKQKKIIKTDFTTGINVISKTRKINLDD